MISLDNVGSRRLYPHTKRLIAMSFCKVGMQTKDQSTMMIPRKLLNLNNGRRFIIARSMIKSLHRKKSNFCNGSKEGITAQEEIDVINCLQIAIEIRTRKNEATETAVRYFTV